MNIAWSRDVDEVLGTHRLRLGGGASFLTSATIGDIRAGPVNVRCLMSLRLIPIHPVIDEWPGLRIAMASRPPRLTR